MSAHIRRFSCMVIVGLLLMSTTPVSTSEVHESTAHPTPSCNANRTNWTVGLIFCEGNASTGFTLFSSTCMQPPLGTGSRTLWK